MGKTEIKRLIFGLRWVLHVLMFSTEQRAPVLLINRPTAFFPFHLPRVHISYGGTCHHLKTPQICFQIRLNGFSLHTEYWTVTIQKWADAIYGLMEKMVSWIIFQRVLYFILGRFCSASQNIQTPCKIITNYAIVFRAWLTISFCM